MTPVELALTFLGIAATACVAKVCIGMTWSRTITIFGGAVAFGSVLGLVIAAATGLWRF